MMDLYSSLNKILKEENLIRFEASYKRRNQIFHTCWR